MEEVIILIFLLVVTYILRWLLYLKYTLDLVPKILDKYGFSEDIYKEEKLSMNVNFREYKFVKINGKNWYFPPEAYNKSTVWSGYIKVDNLYNSEERAFNYINRKRYPLRLGMFS